jgi:aminomethyltransferase
MRRTPLHSVHQRLGARLVPFAGWEMPVQYTGIVAEHRAVRTAAGLFDVSHMGELDLRGPGAAAAVARLTCADVDRIDEGQARYSLVLDEAAGIIDDVIVYRLADRHYRLVVNASNTEAVLDHARTALAGISGTELTDRSDDLALLAIQGPRALAIVAHLTDGDVASIGNYRCRPEQVAGHPVLLARTGYTGEDGFELFAAAGAAEALWNALLEAGAAAGLQAAGLGARDTLRLEASMPLYGHELTRDVSPLEVGLGRFVSRGDGYIGAAAIAAQRAAGVPRRLVCLHLAGRAIARQGFAITTAGGSAIGTVTSGSHGPWLQRSIAMGLVPREHAARGNELAVLVRGRAQAAAVVARPFYKRTDNKRSD